MRLRKILWILLGLEAALCVAFCVLRVTGGDLMLALLSFPFAQIGDGLRALSLSGGLGNAAAFVLYIALSLTPLIPLLIMRKRRNLRLEDSLLGLLSIVLFVVLYLSINPGLLVWMEGATLAVGRVILGSVAYSMLVGYLVLRLLRAVSAQDGEKLFRYMQFALCAAAAFFVYAALGVSLPALVAAMTAESGALDMAFHVLQFITDALPYTLNLAIVFAALRLLAALCADRYAQETVDAALRLSRLCTRVLAATVLANIAFNLLQLLFANALTNINSTLRLPLDSLIFVLLTLLLTRFIASGKALSDENRMFI